jgi:hypothetical protein
LEVCLNPTVLVLSWQAVTRCKDDLMTIPLICPTASGLLKSTGPRYSHPVGHAEETMNEADWLTSTDPQAMLAFLRDSGKLSERKARLFAVACCRRVGHLLTDGRSRAAVEAGECFADGVIPLAELALARAAAETAHAEASATADDAMRAMSHGGFNYYANLRATSFATGAAVGCASDSAWIASDSAWIAATSVADRLVAIASTQSTSNLEAVWWGWDDPSAAAEQAALEADARHVLCALICDLFGSPFRPLTISPTVLSWNEALVVRLARAAYDERHLPSGHLGPERLAVLADALEEAGADAELVGHLRGPGPHTRGCWAVDALLGKG